MLPLPHLLPRAGERRPRWLLRLLAIGSLLSPLASGSLLALLAPAADAAWDPPPGVDLTRPRLLFRSEDLPAIRARLDQVPLPEPYPTLLDDLFERIALAGEVALEDESIDGQRRKARAAKNLAFLYAVDRTWVDGEVVPFPDAAAREAVGDRARDLLLNLYPRCRLAVPAPLGGWDRDISTSEELMQYAVAYDTLLGAGYDFGEDEEEIVRRLTDLASELAVNYRRPRSVENSPVLLHQNNHRSKSGAALAVAGIALAERGSDPETDPRRDRDPATWVDYGLRQADLVMRYVLSPGDGIYGEGPFYMRFASQNLLPFWRAWDRLMDGAPYEADGLVLPSMQSHPLFERFMRWMLDMTLPDGSLAPLDDGNPGRSYYFGAIPPILPQAPAFYWRWARAPRPYETDGNIDLAADALVVYDGSVEPAPPAGSPSAFYVEGGHAVLRSDWSEDAVVAVVSAEHDEASEFGRDRSGEGRWPQSHEHAEPGAFLLRAFGERLALDPGYLSFGERELVNGPEKHSTILVNGHGPVDYLGATFAWNEDLLGRPPADGQASLVAPLDTGFLDAARVVTRYGALTDDLEDPRHAHVDRRFLFPDHRYLAIADRVESEADPPAVFTWLLQGNGGGTSGGSYEALALGGRWTRPGARLDGVLAFDAGAADLDTSEEVHEDYGGEARTHTALRAIVPGPAVRSVALVYPTRAEDAAPTASEVPVEAGAGLLLTDEDGDRRVLAVHRAPGRRALRVPAGVSGLAGPAATDGSVALFDARLDGSLRMAFASEATFLSYDGTRYLRTVGPARMGIALDAGASSAEVVVENGEPWVEVHGLPFAPQAVDGGCALDVEADVARVRLGRERRFVLRNAPGNARPAADPGPDVRAAVDELVTFDGTASCDADGQELTPRWQLVAAPPGSAWSFEGADGWHPTLLADVAGAYRARLVVTDAQGAESLPLDVLVAAGGPCEDGIDDDRDGRFDGDDPDCDAPVIVECGNGIDDDGDGAVDAPADPGCADAQDLSERADGLACDDGLDGDGDGLADYPADPGCGRPGDPDEAPACDDGADNDGDGFVDGDDPECVTPWWVREEGCGDGLAAGLALPLLVLAGRALVARSCSRATRSWRARARVPRSQRDRTAAPLRRAATDGGERRMPWR
jgi:hypothetical protein